MLNKESAKKIKNKTKNSLFLAREYSVYNPYDKKAKQTVIKVFLNLSIIKLRSISLFKSEENDISFSMAITFEK